MRFQPAIGDVQWPMISRLARVLGTAALIVASTSATAEAAGGNDAERANAFDDAWEQAWVERCREVFEAGTDKTDGFVLQVGDSITHANPYSQWPRNGAGKTRQDAVLLSWSPADQWGNGNSDSASTNGWYLAAADTSNQRGMTASSGISTNEYVSGDGNGGPAMPLQSDPATARDIVADGGTYPGNLHIQTVAAAFGGAQFAVLMLGTNDISGGRPATDFAADLSVIVDALEAHNIVVVLSTIPPVYDDADGSGVAAYNDEIEQLAQTAGLPLIDFHGEILARQPDGAWNGTLLGMDNVHPSASDGQFNASADPYEPGGVAAEHCTGDAPLGVGYLLRSWLTVQKLKEVRAYVVDGQDPPGTGSDSSGGDSMGDTGDSAGDDAADDTGDQGTSGASGSTGGPNASQGGPGDGGPGDNGTAGGDTSDGTGGTAGQDDDASGCGCRQRQDGPRLGLGALALVLLASTRRRPQPAP